LASRADRQVLDHRIRVDGEAEPRGDLANLGARGVEVQPAALRLLVAEHDVLGDREHRDQHEVLVHHADARRHGISGPGEVLHDVVDDDLAVVGLVEPVQHVHQRGLARTVLAQEAVDLPRLDDEVDVVVGHQGAEALGDAAQLKLHVSHPEGMTTLSAH